MFRVWAVSVLTLASFFCCTQSWSEDEFVPSTTVKHIVVFGNAHSDTGNTRELFDELAGRKKSSLLRDDIRRHFADTLDTATALMLAGIAWAPAWYYGWTNWVDEMPVVSNFATPTRVAVVSVSAAAIKKTGLAHLFGRSVDLVMDRSQLALKALLWFYPSIGLPVLPPGSLYDVNGRFTNGPRVWTELLAQQFGLDPDTSDDFTSLAYAGSHIRQRLSEEDILSFSSLLTDIELGNSIVSTLLTKDSSPAERKGFWDKVAGNMTEQGQTRFKSLLKDGIPPSFEFMVEDYGDKEKYTSLHNPGTTLYIISYGADDYVVDDATPQEVIESLSDGIETLVVRDKARHILITQLQDPLMFPATRTFSDNRKTSIREKVSEHNFMLQESVKGLQEKHPDLAIQLLTNQGHLSDFISTNNLSTEPCLKLANKQEQMSLAYTLQKIPRMKKRTALTDTMLRDSSSLCAASRFIGKTVARCQDPNQFFFYDGFNLTQKAHELIANAVFKSLTKAGYNGVEPRTGNQR